MPKRIIFWHLVNIFFRDVLLQAVMISKSLIGLYIFVQLNEIQFLYVLSCYGSTRLECEMTPLNYAVRTFCRSRLATPIAVDRRALFVARWTSCHRFGFSVFRWAKRARTDYWEHRGLVEVARATEASVVPSRLPFAALLSDNADADRTKYVLDIKSSVAPDKKKCTWREKKYDVRFRTPTRIERTSVAVDVKPGRCRRTERSPRAPVT